MESTTKTRVDLLEVKDVCALYHVEKKAVYRWIKSGKLEGKKAGHKWLFTPEAVEGILR